VETTTRSIHKAVDANLERLAVLYAKRHGVSPEEARLRVEVLRPKIEKHVRGRLVAVATAARLAATPTACAPVQRRPPVLHRAGRTRRTRRVVRRRSASRAGPEPEPPLAAPPRLSRGASACPGWSA